MTNIIEVKTKRCSTCKETKSIFEFHRNRLAVHSVSNECKSCNSIRKANNYKASGYSKHIEKQYGITLEEYEQIKKEQDNKCIICESEFEGNKLAVDHSHTTGKVRGILCKNCNVGLGMFKDNLKFILQAADYLRKHMDAN